MGYRETYDAYAKKVEAALAAYFSDAVEITEPLKSAMGYSLFIGGKRLRPVLTLSANALLDGDEKEVMPIACAMEMIHTYSLIHDDLPAMDDDDLRRGKPTNHKVFGEGMAVLAGDGLLSYAFEIMLQNALSYPNKLACHVRAINQVASGAGVFGMVGGQCMDLYCEGSEEATVEALAFIHKNKTGAMIVSALLAGLLVCSPTKEQIAAVRAYGSDIGLAFQITDDILDIVGDVEKLGKNTGSDERAKKLTYPAMYGLEAAKVKVLELVVSACGHLSLFGEKAAFLKELAVVLSRRES
ncbi:MAG: polyprenyl synthetase family protein [Bacillota bacterium]